VLVRLLALVYDFVNGEQQIDEDWSRTRYLVLPDREGRTPRGRRLPPTQALPWLLQLLVSAFPLTPLHPWTITATASAYRSATSQTRRSSPYPKRQIDLSFCDGPVTGSLIFVPRRRASQSGRLDVWFPHWNNCGLSSLARGDSALRRVRLSTIVLAQSVVTLNALCDRRISNEPSADGFTRNQRVPATDACQDELGTPLAIKLSLLCD